MAAPVVPNPVAEDNNPAEASTTATTSAAPMAAPPTAINLTLAEVLKMIDHYDLHKATPGTTVGFLLP